jgi:hypothetical protein
MSRIRTVHDSESFRNYLIAQRVIDQVNRTHPWYDAVWLRKYVAAKKVIELIRPDMLSQFINAFDRLRTRTDFAVQKLDRVFDDHIMQGIRETITTLPSSAFESHETAKFGRLVVHDHPVFTDLQEIIQPLVSKLAGETVEPSYNFLSLYSQFGVCEPHIDSPEAKWTLDLCVDQTEIWPIHFSQTVPWPEEFNYEGADWQTQLKRSSALQFTSYGLQQNEAVFFSGSSQWHYRDSLSDVADGGYCNLLFFHFLPAGMRKIVRPESWPDMFGISELDAIVKVSR